MARVEGGSNAFLRWFLLVGLLGSLCLMTVEADHYLGGTVSWKVTGFDSANNAMVEVTHRMSLVNPSNPYCAEGDVSTKSISAGFMRCLSSGDVTCPAGTSILYAARDFTCTDYNSGIDWSTGKHTVNVPVSISTGGSGAYYFGYDGCCWDEALGLTGVPNYGLYTSINLPSTTITSSPITSMFPIVMVQRGCTENIRIPMLAEAGQAVSCRLATNANDGDRYSECYSLCSTAIPNTELNPAGTAVGSCTLRVFENDATRNMQGVALIIEGRDTTGNVLSTVPLQFVMQFYGQGTCLPAPTFVGSTPAFGEQVRVGANSQIGTMDIVARSSADDQTITNIWTLSPLSTTKTDLADVDGSNGREKRMTVTFGQLTPQEADRELMCFYAIQSNGVSSEVHCVRVTYEVSGCQTTPCLNGGTCNPSSGDPAYTCSCEVGFMGQNCQNENPCNSAPCQQNAACTPNGDYTDYSCDCPVDYLGKNCQNENPCNSAPCQQNAACAPNADFTDYSCNCPDDYLGKNCENENPCNSAPCQQNAPCAPNADFTDYTCDCPPGVIGKNCDNVSPCNSNPCQQNAACTANADFTDYSCTCPADYRGKNCENENPCNSDPCQQNAACTPNADFTDYSCTCPVGYLGKNCENENPCNSNPCRNGGTCVPLAENTAYRCDCLAGFSGDICQDAYPCQEGAVYSSCATQCTQLSCTNPIRPPGCNEPCVEGCVCQIGSLLEGDRCIPADQCGCEKDGKYYPLNAAYVSEDCTEVCECVATNSFMCQSQACSSDATCRATADSYRCVCNAGFEGNGLNCTQDELQCRVYDDQENCMGPGCQRGCFHSPNYPNSPYTPNTIIQYIVEVPGATYFTLKCDEHFRVEDDRDSLYVGPGKPPALTDLEADPQPPVYLFDGDDAPDRIRLDGDAFWMYFITDRVMQKDGWRCCWIADDPCDSKPCLNDGKCHPKSDGTYTCVCYGGWTGDNCEIDRAHCSAQGEPHYRTFDKKHYHFQGACKYYLVKYCGEEDNNDFNIMVQNKRVRNSARGATTEKVFINIFGHEIGMLQDKRLSLNGVLTSPPLIMPGITVTFKGNKLVARFNTTLEVKWDGESGVNVYLSRDFSSQTCGLCGNMDGDGQNDFKTPDDMTVEGPPAFGNSWKVGSDCNANDLTGGTNPCESAPPGEGERFNMPMLFHERGPFRECLEKIDSSTFIEDILYDWCVTRPDTSASCADIANYASMCQMKGIEVGPWRKDDFCRMECPMNSHYNVCASACPKICGHEQPEGYVCALPCEESCQCDEGFILDGNQRCVPEDQCGCFYEGIYYTDSSSFFNSDCTQSCTCRNQGFECTPNVCDGNAFCGLHDGRHGCHCNEGYIGNGLLCEGDPCFVNPCNKGKCLQSGSSFEGCLCYDGSKGDFCEEERGSCTSYGDPHYLSFDGRKYSYQGGCKYVLVKPCDVGDGPYFRVIQENEKVEGRDVSRTEEVTVEIGPGEGQPLDMVIDLKEDLEVVINDIPVKTPVSNGSVTVTIRGNFLVLSTTFGLEVRWDGRSDVNVRLDRAFFNNTCGLCGNWNGDPEDEFTGFKNREEFGNSWKLDCMVDEMPRPFTCNPNPVVEVLATDVCNYIRSDAFRRCEPLGLGEQFVENCIFDLCSTYPDFKTVCLSLSTYADLCQEAGYELDPWRSRELCPLDCPRHSRYSLCMSACAATCSTPEEDPCKLPCVEGCECDEGYVLAGKKCIRQEECGCQLEYYLENGETHVNSICSEMCTCEQGGVSCKPLSCHQQAECAVREGVRGCHCVEGYYGNGVECEQDPCTVEERCNAHGKCIHEGDGDYHCECYQGWSGKYCDEGMGVCSGHGDPHYTSFDRRRFNFQGKCRYILLMTELEEYNMTFKVVAKNRPGPNNRKVSVTDELHIIIGDKRIELLQRKKVRVDGIDRRTPVRPFPGMLIKRSGKQLLVKTNFSIGMEWNGKSTFSISVSPDYFNRTYGLCGTYDDDRSNDFTARNHTIAENINAFGNSWEEGSCDTPEPLGTPYDPCEENSRNRGQAEELCEIIRESDGPFQKCHRDLDPEPYYTSCMYDMCSTLPDKESLCEDVAMYADNCLAAGVSIEEWRKDDFCSFDCPANSSYSLCAPGCPSTCADLRQNGTDCRERCREGCQCKEGHVLSDNKCVLPEHCGCLYNDRYLEYGEEFYLEDCVQLCRCGEDGAVECEDSKCHKNAECTEKEGKLGCVCYEPQIGDGVEECNYNPCMAKPCKNGGRCEVTDDDDYCCVCSEWWSGRQCEIRQSQCTVYASAHYSSYDSAAFPFVGECSYILSKTCNPAYEPSFEVIQENERFNAQTSVLMAIRVRIGDKHIRLGRGQTCHVNGVKVALPVTLDGINITLSGMNMILKSDIDLKVVYDGWYLATVTVGPRYSDELCGICGDYDRSYRNDYYPEGRRLTGTGIGNLYRVKNEACAIPVEPEYESDGDACSFVSAEIRARAYAFCDRLLEGPLEPCRRILNIPVFLRRCRHDSCASKMDPTIACLHPFVFYKLCLRYGGSPEPWRRVDYCPVNCTQGSHYSPASSACPKTCVDVILNRTPECKKSPPVEACECDDGFVLSGSRCVRENECGCYFKDAYYEPGHVMLNEDCTMLCICQEGKVVCTPSSCHYNASCVVADGRRTCRCNEGYLGNGMECRPSPCLTAECQNGGRCILGREDSYSCYCPPTFGGRHCEFAVQTCLAYSNLHFATFSQIPFDFPGSCKYYLTRSCRGEGPQFAVIKENDRISPTSQASAISEVTVHVYGMKIELSKDHKVTVDGLEILPPFRVEDLVHIYYLNDRVVVSTNFSLEVSWDGVHFVLVRLAEEFFNQTCGLCGDMQGSIDQDLSTRLGSREALSEFGDMFKADAEECDSVTGRRPPDECTAEAQELVKPVCNFISDIRGPFRRCLQSVRQIIFNNCNFDGCALSPHLNFTCPAFTTLAKMCQLVGLQIDPWRTDDFCPMRCPENSEYGLCVNPCQRRCGQEQRPAGFVCPYPCEEGCQCKEGYVLDADRRCKRLEECGCFDNGYYHLNSEEYYREGCMERCECEGGVVTCEPVECHENATCGVDDGDYGCYCNEGYIGNGRECEDDPCDPNPCQNDGICKPAEGEWPYKCTCVGHWKGSHCEMGYQACSVSGHTHYDRFDGFVFDFYGNCSYVLTMPCVEREEDMFKIILENEPDDDIRGLPNIEAVHVMVNEMRITLKDDMEFEVNGEEMRFPFRRPGLVIDQYGWFMKVTTDFGLVVAWNGEDLVEVTLPSDFRASTCGVCGDISNPVEGFGESENANQYAWAWVDKPENCHTSPEPWQPCKERACNVQPAVQLCSMIMAPRDACPPGWTAVGLNDLHYMCYFVRPAEEGLTFEAANLECQRRGGRLYDPALEEQDQRLRNWTAGTFEGNYWLDCSDEDEENSWRCRRESHRWSTEEVSGFWSWDAMEPNNGPFPTIEEDCIMVFDENRWRTVPCTALATKLICQIDVRIPHLAPFKECHELVSPKPYFQGCMNDVCAALPSRDWLCSALRAYADVCRLAGAKVDLWQSRDLCPPSCPEGASFTRCASPCPPTCAHRDRACALPCKPGCKCNDGLVLQGDKCVRRDECGCFAESLGQFIKAGERYFKPNCTESCSCMYGGMIQCHEVNCTENGQCDTEESGLSYECSCEDGFAFDGNKCAPDACAAYNVQCENGGVCRARGLSEYSCLCQFGWAGRHCEEEMARCSVQGYHHYRTFDKQPYNFNGDCVYHLAHHCGEDVEEPQFKILEKNQRHPLQNNVTSTLWLEIHLSDMVIRLMQGHRVLVNGTRRNLPVNLPGGRIRLLGNSVVLHTMFGLGIKWDGRSFTDIIIPEVFKNQTCGLCGNYDGEHDNDLRIRDGELAASAAEFGNSWVYNDEDCKPDNGDLPPFDCGALLGIVHSFCNNLQKPVVAVCGRGGFLIDNCLADVCRLGNARFGCGYSSWLVGSCRARGGHFKEAIDFPEPCNTHQCPENSEYDFCMGTCEEQTCDDIRGFGRSCPIGPCVEGCKCKEGFARSGLQCVPWDKCGCVDHRYDGAYYEEGQKFARRGCKEHCECENGTISCEPLDCHCQAECRTDRHGRYGCHCPPPYMGNGLECAVDPCFSNPCENDGKCLTLQNGNYTCACKPQWTGQDCEIEQRNCSVSGNPQHFKTFDGASYNFFGTCKYTLVSDCSDKPVFKVVIENEPSRGRPGLTKVKSVYVLTGGYVLGLHQHKQLSLNGSRVSAPVVVKDRFIVQTGTHVVLKSTIGVTLRWNGYSDVDVWVASNSGFNLCGLCGNTDGNPLNILDETPDRQRVLNSVAFANTWAENPETCKDRGTDVENSCNGDIEVAAASVLCNVILNQAGPFGRCIAHVDPEPFYTLCRFSVCASGQLTNYSTICSSLHLLEKACRDRSIEVGQWRHPKFCEPQCPSGSEFRPSGPVCGQTCFGLIHERSLPCPFFYQAGCQCAPDYYQSGNECVLKEHCGCIHEGLYRKAGEVFISSDCKARCTCKRGNRVECEEHRCKEDTFCGAKDKVHGCHCKDGYEDDGCQGCRANPCLSRPCQNGGNCTVISDDNFFCDCPDGFAGRQCDEVLSQCTISGDRHYKTFDGRRYRFSGVCQYILLHNCFDSENAKFTVLQTTRMSESNPGVTETHKIAIFVEGVDGYYLEIFRGNKLYINSVRQFLPVIYPWSEIHHAGSWIVLRDHRRGLVLRYDGEESVEIFLRGKHGKTCGLCGVLDNDQSNDFLQQFTGAIATDAVQFGNSWKNDPTCAGGSSLPSQCDGDTNKHALADNACNIIRDTVGSLSACHSVIGYELFYNRCMYDTCKALPDTSARCANIRDYVQQCIKAGVAISPGWRQEKNCYLTCPEHSHYSSCISSCPDSCLARALYQDTRRCLEYCNDGCECDEGYVLSDDTCIRKEECGCYALGLLHNPTAFPVNHVLITTDCEMSCTCGADGQVTCQNITCDDNAMCQHKQGEFKCVCNDGLVGDGLTCNVSPCVSNPCQNGGTCHVDGGGSAYYCVCRLGWGGTVCSSATYFAVSYGDPHYRTFDGVYYNFMGQCSYKLFEMNCQPGGLTVFQVNELVGGTSQYTIMKELIIQTPGKSILMVPNGGFTIDGLPQTLPYDEAGGLFQMRRVGNCIIVRVNPGVEIKWDGGYNVDITLDRIPPITVCGLFGDADGNSNDFDDGNPLTVDTAITFGNSHLVQDPTCLHMVTVQPDPCADDPIGEKAELISYACRPLDSSQPNYAFQGCSEPVDTYFQACKHDICVTSIADPTACRIIATYAQVCRDLGFENNGWRSERLCGVQTCPDNAMYAACADPCPKTCRKPDLDTQPCHLRCAEGCTCEEGYYQEDGKCLQPQDCGCTFMDGERYLKKTDYYDSEGCSMRCSCSEAFGEIVCVPGACHADATCETVNGLQKCVCKDGFVGDGQQCDYAECYSNPCVAGVCQRRMGGSPNYVCECPESNVMGNSCDIPAEYSERFACYGAQCATTMFSSPGYDEPNTRYPDSWTGFYQVWVPTAKYIKVTFQQPFEIEEGRDYLYLGYGFQYPTALNSGPRATDANNQFYQLDGFAIPGPIYVKGDAVWMYFKTDSQTRHRGWKATLEAEFTDLSGTAQCWDGTQTRLSGPAWRYGRCDDCTCTDVGHITCSLMASKPISCTSNADCPSSTACVSNDNLPLCQMQPCSGMYCTVGTIYDDCEANPRCARLSVSAINPNTPVFELCNAIIAAAEQFSTDACFTYECVVQSDGSRKRRAADDSSLTVDIYLESGSPSDSVVPAPSQDGMTPVDSLAFSLFDSLSVRISDGSIPINITDVTYLGPRPSIKTPLTTKETVTLKKVTAKPVENSLTSSIIIIVIGSCLVLALLVAVMTAWCRRQGKRSSKKTVTFQAAGQEAHTNEVFEMVDPGPAFSRAIPVDDGIGGMTNVYVTKYDLDS